MDTSAVHSVMFLLVSKKIMTVALFHTFFVAENTAIQLKVEMLLYLKLPLCDMF